MDSASHLSYLICTVNSLLFFFSEDINFTVLGSLIFFPSILVDWQCRYRCLWHIIFSLYNTVYFVALVQQ